MGLLDTDEGKRRLLAVDLPILERYNQERDREYRILAQRQGTGLVLRYRLKPPIPSNRSGRRWTR